MACPELPAEIWHTICAYFCTFQQFLQEHDDFWHNEDSTDEAHSEDAEESVIEGDSKDNEGVSKIYSKGHLMEISGRPLLNLCLVSKLIHSVAAGHLYAFFNGRTDKAVLFLRTLVERPQYSAYVRGLLIEPVGKDWSWESLEEDSESDWVSFALFSMLHQAGNVSKSFPRYLTSLSLRENWARQEIIAQFLILHLPNLEILKISMPEEWSFKLLSYVAEFKSSIVPRLKTLHVFGPPRWQRFRGSPSMIHLNPIASLLSLSHLEDICLDDCVAFEGSSEFLNHARRIAHWKCGATKCQISKLLSSCTALECYELEYFGGIALDLSYLSPSKRSLQCLTLEVHDFVPNLLTEYETLKKITLEVGSIDMRHPGQASV